MRKPTGETPHGVTGSSSYTETFAGDQPAAAPTAVTTVRPADDERLHHYHHRLRARRPQPRALKEFRLVDVRAGIEGHVLDQGELVATYTLHADKL